MYFEYFVVRDSGDNTFLETKIQINNGQRAKTIVVTVEKELWAWQGKVNIDVQIKTLFWREKYNF